jgi:SAM-dependent methyltransferase
MTFDSITYPETIFKGKKRESRTKLNKDKKNEVEYDTKFFADERESSLRSAKVIVPFIMEIIKPKSVVDFGCGVGSFLYELRNLGVQEILGIDGTYLDDNILMVPEEFILKCDLSKEIKLERKYDLCISLEVAEHIDSASAEIFISNLTNSADVILFSAAIPGQGGTHHVNEQWPTYWAKIFEKRGFVAIDCIRPLIWDNENVDPVYSQNTIIYAKKDTIENYGLNQWSKVCLGTGLTRLVHPKIFAAKSQNSIKVFNPLMRQTILLLQLIYRKYLGHTK